MPFHAQLAESAEREENNNSGYCQKESVQSYSYCPEGKVYEQGTCVLCLILTLLPTSPNVVYEKESLVVKRVEIVVRNGLLKPKLLVPPSCGGLGRVFVARALDRCPLLRLRKLREWGKMGEPNLLLLCLTLMSLIEELSEVLLFTF